MVNVTFTPNGVQNNNAANTVKILTPNTVKQGDTKNDFRVQLFKGETPVDLTGANVTWSAASNKGKFVTGRAATVESDGIVGIAFTADDQGATGSLRVEFKVAYADGDIEKFPAQNYAYFEITRSLDDLSHVPVLYASVQYFEQKVALAETSAVDAAASADAALKRAVAVEAQGEVAEAQGLFAQEQGAEAQAQAAAAQQVATENKTRFLNPVSTVALRDSTYPNPVHGDTVRVTSEAAAYRFQTGAGWVKTDEYNPTAIDNLSASLADTESQLRTTQSNPTNYNGAIVTIIDDDARPDFRTVWQPILDANPDVKIGIAVVKDWTEAGSSLSITELRTLQDAGHDILPHTVHHEASYLITPERAEADYPVSKKFMKDNGFKAYEHLVYPGGLNPTSISIKDVARKHFKYAISTQTAGDYAVTPVDNWCVPRIDGDGKTLEQLKAAVDYAKANGIWLILMTHSHVLLAEGSQKMTDFIAYVKSQSVPIMPFTEAVKRKGNAVALGEYTSAKSRFISINGDARGFLVSNSGSWTPKLVGHSAEGVHTYTTQTGKYVKLGNLVTAEFNIRIDYANLDTAMNGYLRIKGLPFLPASDEVMAKGILDYNIINLGTNYTTALISANGAQDYLTLVKIGNGVAGAYVNKTDLPASQVVVLTGQITYRTP